MAGEATIGPNALLERFLDEYGLGVDSWVADVLEDDTARLQLALLLEQRGDEDVLEAVDDAKRSQSGGQTKTGDYWSTEGAIGLSDDWQEIDFEGLVSSSIDLRISNADVVVRFEEPGVDDADVFYGTAESPVVGIPVETTKMWAKNDPAASTDASLKVQAWG